MPARVLVLGLDSLDERVLRDGIERGECPTLRDFLGGSLVATSVWPRPFGTASLWATVWTGVGPFVHRMPFWGERPDARGRRSCERPGVYELAARRGLRVAVLDACYAPRGEGYVHVADWLTHGEQEPATAVGEIGGRRAADLAARRLGEETWCRCDTSREDGETRAGLRDRLLARARRHADFVEESLAAEPWDLAVTVASLPHCAIHHFWPDTADAQEDLGTLLRGIDSAVARILGAAGPDAQVVLVTGQGGRPHTSASHLVGDLLARTFDGLPRGLRSRVGRSAWDRVTGKRDVRSDRAWRTIAYHDFAGAVRVRRMARDARHGATDAEADVLLAALERVARGLVDLDTGRPAVAEFVRTAERFPIADVSTWPDAFLVWNDAAPLRRVGSPDLGELTGPRWAGRTGDHRPEGLVAVRGPVAPERLLGAFPLERVAPTVADLLGFEMPGVEAASLLVGRGARDHVGEASLRRAASTLQIPPPRHAM